MPRQKKEPKAYLIYWCIYHHTRTKNFLSDYYKISRDRVNQLYNKVAAERYEHPDEFQKNFLSATGFQFTEKI